jgi:peptidyl-prolyl cis-trans isomerase C
MRRWLSAAALGAGLLAGAGPLSAVDGSAATPDASPSDDAGEAARRAQPVAHVGPRVITVGELEDRIAAMPPFQRVTFGATPDAIRRKYLSDVLVPEVLLAAGAEAQKLADDDPTKLAVQRARSQAAVRAIRARIGPESAIPMAEVQKYYDDNRDRYDTPQRIQIWRILCKTEDDARAVLDLAKKDLTPKTFQDLARDRSLDKATNLRGGNVGFVNPDGTSNEPGLRIDPVVVRAAEGVRDGELVAAPVEEGEYFAVVWRRGTIPPNKRSVDDAAAQIRDAIWKARVKEETDKLVAGLRAARLTDLHDDLLLTIDLPLDDAGGATVHKPPRQVAPGASSN